MKTNEARNMIIAAAKEAGVEMSDAQTDKAAAAFAKSMTAHEWANRVKNTIAAVAVIAGIVAGIVYIVF